jgi:hypothetical protein
MREDLKNAFSVARLLLPSWRSIFAGSAQVDRDVSCEP